MTDDIGRDVNEIVERARIAYRRYCNTVFFVMALLRLNTFVEDFAAYSRENPATREDMILSVQTWRRE